MPYIRQENRVKLMSLIDEIYKCKDYYKLEAGDINYIITVLLKAYMEHKEKNYTLLNEVIGILECAKQEFYRREVAPYEQKKIAQNGDVYEE